MNKSSSKVQQRQETVPSSESLFGGRTTPFYDPQSLPLQCWIMGTLFLWAKGEIDRRFLSQWQIIKFQPYNKLAASYLRLLSLALCWTPKVTAGQGLQQVSCNQRCECLFVLVQIFYYCSHFYSWKNLRAFSLTLFLELVVFCAKGLSTHMHTHKRLDYHAHCVNYILVK